MHTLFDYSGHLTVIVMQLMVVYVVIFTHTFINICFNIL